jgi:glycosyltransferase involved in cell wall biosynthesis
VLLNRIDGVAAMSTVHGWTGASGREKVPLLSPWTSSSCGLLPRVVTVSDDIRQQLLKRRADPARVRTVLNGIDHRAFHRDRSREASVRSSIGLTTDDVVIGSVGRLEVQKRFDLLIDA